MDFHLILTLDYEIFGNGSGCLDQCVVKPVDKLLDLLERYNARCSFFVDATEFLIMSQQPVFKDKMYLIESQLADLTERGHSIQLHLHPQWHNATFEGGSWRMDLDAWRIGDVSEDLVQKLIEDALSYLTPFTDKPLTTFRAGGWAIQESKGRKSISRRNSAVLEQLAENGIVMDSTVAPGVWNLAPGDWFNFSDCPAMPYWQVGQHVNREDGAGKILEVPITTANLGIYEHYNALRSRKSQGEFPEGCVGSYAGPNNKVESLMGKVSKLARLGQMMLDFSSLSDLHLRKVTEQHMQCYAEFETPVPIVAICHNKNFTDWSAVNLEKYLDWLDRSGNVVHSDFDTWYQCAHPALTDGKAIV